MSSRRLMVALAALIPLTFSAAAHAQSKIGYVNFQKALAELDEAKAARTRLEGIKEQKQKDLDKAKGVIVLKRSMNPGFAGIENHLFYAPNTSMLFGDAKSSLTRLVSEVKAL